MINVPGFTTDLGISPMPNITPGEFGYTGEMVGNGWISNASNYMDEGQPSGTNTVSHLGDEPVTYSYALNTWNDGTHVFIQEGMLLFGVRHIDTKNNTYTGAPIFKLNVEQATQMTKFKNFSGRVGSEALQFKNLLAKHGESVLDAYHCDLNRGNSIENVGDLPEFYRLAQKAEFRYLTQFGIKNLWNLLGAVVSKGEATGGNVSLDLYNGTDMLFIAGVSVAKRAECLNLWGNVSPGSKLFLILTRLNKDSPLQWIPYSDRSREYPARQYRTYVDESGRICKSYILPIGTVSETIIRVPSTSQINQAAGLYGATVKEGYEAHGTLGSVIVQLGI